MCTFNFSAEASFRGEEVKHKGFLRGVKLFCMWIHDVMHLLKSKNIELKNTMKEP